MVDICPICSSPYVMADHLETCNRIEKMRLENKAIKERMGKEIPLFDLDLHQTLIDKLEILNQNMNQLELKVLMLQQEIVSLLDTYRPCQLS